MTNIVNLSLFAISFVPGLYVAFTCKLKGQTAKRGVLHSVFHLRSTKYVCIVYWAAIVWWSLKQIMTMILVLAF